MHPRSLSWGLVVATYNRRDLLVRCVRQALAQTRPPAEIVIVDASTAFEEHESAVRAAVAEHSPTLPVRYERAKRPQQTVQRNQAVQLASSDVLFMIDDDSLMYPACAERIMQVYERPGCEQVVSVMAALHPRPPDTALVASEPAEPPSRFFGLASQLSTRLKGDFYPDFAERPHFPIPALGPGVHVTENLHGARITVRREVALREPFDEALLFNAHEDRDAAFRFRGLGVLAEVAEPLICHVEAVRDRGAARRGFVYRGAWLLNYAYLVQKWCPDRRDLARAYAIRFARSMLALDFLSSVRTREFHRVLGVDYVRRRLLPRLLQAPSDKLPEVAMALSLELRSTGQARG
jgi:glycosyltransferase involved in cell wall biosynthesis